jgi:hypothetical protein
VEAVLEIRRGVYRCRQCAAEIVVGDDATEPMEMLVAASGEANERVVMVAGREVHRCPIPDHRHN